MGCKVGKQSLLSVFEQFGDIGCAYEVVWRPAGNERGRADQSGKRFSSSEQWISVVGRCPHVKSSSKSWVRLLQKHSILSKTYFSLEQNSYDHVYKKDNGHKNRKKNKACSIEAVGRQKGGKNYKSVKNGDFQGLNTVFPLGGEAIYSLVIV